MPTEAVDNSPIDATKVAWDQPAPVQAQPNPAGGAGAPAPAGGIDPSHVTWDQPQASAQPQDNSVTGYLAHQGGLFARGMVQGALALPGAISDAVTSPINLGLDLALGKDQGFRFKHVGDVVGGLMDQAGVAQPQTGTERVVQDVMKGAGGAVSGVGLGAAIESTATGPFTQAIGRMLQQAPTMQLASGAASGGAEGIAREAGASPMGQAIAGVAGAVAPTAIQAGATGAVRGIVRGGEEGAQQMQRTMDAFQDAAGATPTLGQATQQPVLQGLETGAANTLLGDGIMARAARRQLDAMDGTINDLVGQMASSAAPEDAGDAILRGVRSFRDSFKATQKNLYGKLDQFIPADTPVAVDATKQAMAELNSDIAGAPALSKWFKNAKIQGLEDALQADTAGAPSSVHVYPQPPRAGGGIMNSPVPQDPLQVAIPESPPTNTLPYQALQKLRTLVGQELSNNSLVSDVPRSKWQRLYGALSEDLGTAAAEAGPDAQKAWQQANDYTAAGMQRLDRLDTVVSKDLPEQIYNTAMGTSGDGGTRLRTVMKSLPSDDKKQVIATFLQRMGRATAGAQDATGERFSSDVFLTNYNKMSAEAKQALFNSNAFPGLGKKLDALAQMASTRKDSGKVFANPSGTGKIVIMASQVSNLVHAISTGSPTQIAAAAGAIMVPAGFAKLATSPDAVKWMARSTELSPAAMPAAAEAAVRGASVQQQPQQGQHLANGGEVTYRGYPAAAKARRDAGIEADIVPTPGGFKLQRTGLKLANGGDVDPTAAIDAQAHEAASSPLNDHPEPTEAQAQAGNYKKGHVALHGMFISVENPAGSTRRGTDPDGTPWESTIQGGHYGYIRGTKGADGDHLDVFVGPNPESKTVHVVDQVKPDGSFDEHKALLGYQDADAAKAAYLSNYPAGWQGLGGMTSMPMAAFKAWARSGRLKEPLGDLA